MVAIGAMVLLVGGVMIGDTASRVVSWLAIVLLAGAAWIVFANTGTNTAFHGAFVVDGFARFTKLLILAGSAFCLLMANEFFALEERQRFELPILMLLATLGMMLMVSASSFIALYMGLELQSLALYVLAAFQRDNLRSTEAGLKYFVLGALSSGMLLYGISLIYGFTGTTEFHAIAVATAQPGADLAHNYGLIFGLVFLIAGLAFKVGAVPFHMWTPDVYEGSPTPVTAFFVTAAKVAAFALFIRAVIAPFPAVAHQWQQIIVIVSMLSVILGAVAAIGQTNIKRLLAYSSIGHVGYALLGLAAGTQAGIQGMLVYLAYYLVTNLGMFACIAAMRRDGESVEDIRDLAGLARTQPYFALALGALTFSLAGLPPLAGIFAKIYVFGAAMQAHLYIPAIINIVASVIGAFYYLRIIQIMYFDEPKRGFDHNIGGGTHALMWGTSAISIFFVVLPAPLIAIAGQAAHALFP
ncbi:MAG: NADH-quinone oxidoreductase subunit NuoN [Alphaproteobacteria bacterium]|nr:NADH-quinone oxidoreductase subunit NuoN [Alphaproteobacteria bacterium]MBL7096732.1 NADH-quinone oxidoreductase subunit NuoN [Alphaproteobacteria bacterium]